MNKRILWLAITCLMVLSLVLVSCGKTTPVTTTTTQTQTTTATTTQTTATTTATTTVKPTTTTTTATTTKPAGTPQYGGIFKIGDYRLSTVLGNPARWSQGYAQRQSQPAIEGLFRVDASGKLVPFLAKSWVEDPVAKTITITLNTGIKFQDGTPFNAAAVKWNLDAAVAAKQTGNNLISSVDVVNDSTVRVNMPKWDNTLSGLMGYHFLAGMISPTTAQKMGTEWINTHPVGTGPFSFETWIPQVTISYSKFNDYWQSGKPYLDRIETIIIVDQTVGLLNFKAGKTDQFIDPAIQDLPSLKKDYPGTVPLPFAAFATHRGGAIFDSADPKSPFANIKVRQAFNYAVDMKSMNQAVFAGNGQITNGFISGGNYGWNPDTVGYPYNADKAKQLLAEAGYGPSSPLKVTLYHQTGSEYEAVSQTIQGFLKAVGVDCQVSLSLASVLNQWYTKWDGLVAITAVPNPDPVTGFTARYIGADPRYFAEMLIPADYKQAILDAAAAPDLATKIKRIQEADKLFVDKYCLAMLWVQPGNTAVNQAWLHDDGLYKVATSSLWTPELTWKDKGK